MTTILLIDDHDLVRQGVARLLACNADFNIIAEASSGEEGFRQYFQHKPDVVILDIHMPGEGGLAMLRRITSRDEQAKVLMVSSFEDVAMVVRALDYGAKGFISKNAPSAVLNEAVMTVSKGKPFIEQGLYDKMHARPLQEQNPLEVLSTRELEVFMMLAEGRSVVEIAELLHLSPKTVGAHRTSIMKKLQLSNSAQIVRAAIQWDVLRLT